MTSFVLPVYNCYRELKSILPAFINVVEKTGAPYEIIIVDDGSEKKLALDDCMNEHCKLLVNDKNQGKGYAVKRGMEQATGDEIIFMDGDFPFDLSVVETAVATLSKPGVDMIIGDRTLAGSSFAEVPFIRAAGSRIISFIVGRFITPGYYDTQCGIKGFKNAVARGIFSRLTVTGFSFDVEVVFIALQKKYNIEKIPVKVEKQLSSNVKVVFHGFEMLWNFFRIKIHAAKGAYK